MQGCRQENYTSSSFILLSRAAKDKKYAQEYLSLLARRGDLGSIRIGKRWYTTNEWMEQFLQTVEEKKKASEQSLKVDGLELEVEKSQASSGGKEAKEIVGVFKGESKEDTDKIPVFAASGCKVKKSFADITRKAYVGKAGICKDKAMRKREPEKTFIALNGIAKQPKGYSRHQIDLRRSATVKNKDSVKLKIETACKGEESDFSELPETFSKRSDFGSENYFSLDREIDRIEGERDLLAERKGTLFPSPNFVPPAGTFQFIFPKLAFSLAFMLLLVMVVSTGLIFRRELAIIVFNERQGKVAGASYEKEEESGFSSRFPSRRESSASGARAVRSAVSYYLANLNDRADGNMSFSKFLVKAAVREKFSGR